MQLDDIVSSRTDFRAVIDDIAGTAEQLIEVLRGHPGSTVELGLTTAPTSRRRRQPGAMNRPNKGPSAARAPPTAAIGQAGRPNTADDGQGPGGSAKPAHKAHGSPPTAKMVAYAKNPAGNIGNTVRRSAILPAQSTMITDMPEGLYQDWHPASRRQLLVVLSGTLEVETSDGRKHRCSSGETFLADDVGSRGHRTRTIGGPARVLFVHLPPEASLGGKS